MSGLGLIDKINLHYKVGDYMNLTFSDEEMVFVDRIDKANTWKEVVKICEDLYEYAKENESETDMSDHEWDEGMIGDDDEEDWNEDYDPSDYEDSDSDDNSDDSKENCEEGENENDEEKSSGSENSDEESDEEGF